MKTAENSALQVLEGYKAAVFHRDVGAFMSLYDREVRVFDAWGVWSYEGDAAWRTAIEQWFASLGAERVVVTFDDVQTTAGPSLTLVSAIVTYAGVSAEGQELRAMQNRLTWALKPDGAGWRIVHEHTSVPVSVDESKPILHREKGPLKEVS